MEKKNILINIILRVYKLKWKIENMNRRDLLKSIFFKKYDYDIDISRTYKIKVYKNNNLINNNSNSTPFILLNPYGMMHEEKIKGILSSNKIEILKEYRICDYNSLVIDLHNKRSVEEYYIELQLIEKNFGHSAKVICIKESDCDKLIDIKRKVRKKIGVFCIYSKYKNQNKEFIISPIHSPDLKNIDNEYNIVSKYFVNENDLMENNV